MLIMLFRWTEPTILLLIIANAVILTIQSARGVTLDSEDDTPPRIRGYFHTWEDFALFALFIIFTYVTEHERHGPSDDQIV
jgi:voltage-dependent calcium channel